MARAMANRWAWSPLPGSSPTRAPARAGATTTGAISTSELTFSWWTWWVGDTIGVLVFAPLLLVWGSEVSPIVKRRRIWVSVPLGCTFVVVVLLFLRARDTERKQVELLFQNRVDRLAQALTRKLELFGAVMERFLGAGYTQIGMDHFALPHDELAIAAAERRLHRNFMGYTTKPATDMIGLGVSAIGDVAGAFAQNTRKLSTYYQALDAGRLPVERGYVLDEAIGVPLYQAPPVPVSVPGKPAPAQQQVELSNG